MAASARARFLRWLAITLAVMTVIAGAAILVGQRVLRERVELARERMNSEPPTAPGPARLEGEDPTAWLLAIDEAEPQEELEVPEECADAEEDARIALSGESRRFSAWNLAEPDPISGCKLAILRAQVASAAPQLELARQVGRYGALRMPDLATTQEEFAPLHPSGMPTAIALVRILSESATLAAADGDSSRALADLRLARRAIRLLDERDSSIVWLAVRFTRGIWVNALTRLAQWLPPEVDLSEFHSEFEGTDPWQVLEASMLSDRRIILGWISSLRQAASSDFAPGPMMLGHQAWLDHEETLLLDAYSAALEGARAHRAPPWYEKVNQQPWNRLFCMAAPPARNNHDALLASEAFRLLTLGILIARRDGPKAAVEWTALQVDPYSGRPLRFRRDGDVLFLWSIGPNGVDDNGSFVPAGNDELPPDAVVSIRVR
ncbi:MAG: hypothetical protein NTV21_09480 [Planctomycetota bacterium]|nr:hypothetical protein [Planctomycetota bacterium]